MTFEILVHLAMFIGIGTLFVWVKLADRDTSKRFDFLLNRLEHQASAIQEHRELIRPLQQTFKRYSDAALDLELSAKQYVEFKKNLKNLFDTHTKQLKADVEHEFASLSFTVDATASDLAAYKQKLVNVEAILATHLHLQLGHIEGVLAFMATDYGTHSEGDDQPSEAQAAAEAEDCEKQEDGEDSCDLEHQGSRSL